MSRSILTYVAVACWIACPCYLVAQEAVVEAVKDVVEAVKDTVEKSTDAETKEKKDGTKTAEETDNTASVEKEKPLDPRFLKLHLTDGSIVAGKLGIENLTISTEFGLLSIPIKKIQAFRPGLSSYNTLREELNTLVKQLGDNNYETRQAAQRSLSGMGLRIKDVIGEFESDGNAERKRRLTEIKKNIQTQLEELIEDEEKPDYNSRPWINEDEIVTESFTIVGKIQEEQFALKSNYGALSIALNDVAFGERPVSGRKPYHKSATVDGSNLAQSGFKLTSVRVQKGDIVTIKAEGEITMSPWGSRRKCGPAGSSEFGWYKNSKIEAGALVAQIGTSGEIFKVGQKLRFVSKKTGRIGIAIGMNPSYASGYNFPGSYKLRIKVQPK